MLTWREVAKEPFGGTSIYTRCKEAKEFNYDYFAFNGRVFSVKNQEKFICSTEDLDNNNSILRIEKTIRTCTILVCVLISVDCFILGVMGK